MNKPLIVAEISASHNGSLETAMKLVEDCAKAGASMIKLQTWTPDTMVVDPSLVIEAGPWAGRNMQELYRQAHTPWEWHVPLFAHAQNLGMVAFSSVFDLQALEFLESIHCPMYKIASFDCVDLELIRHVASTGKPVVISTGMATWGEIVAARDVAVLGGCNDLTLMLCSSSYPAPLEGLHLPALHLLAELGCNVGFSDHTIGITSAMAAVALGADMIEKHVRMSDDIVGLDNEFAAPLFEFEALVNYCNDVAAAIAMPQLTDPEDIFGVQPAERPQALLRKSLFVIKDVMKGDAFSADNVRAARPATGLHCREYSMVLGKTASRNIRAGTPLSWSMISQG